jgi:hypothetical protein
MERTAYIFDPDSQTSVVNSVVPELAKVIVEIPDKWFRMSLDELEDKNTAVTEKMLRVSFWREMAKRDAALREYKKRGFTTEVPRIRAVDIFRGVCGETTWYCRFLKSPKKIVYMLQPLPEYLHSMHYLLTRATDRLHEIIELPFWDVDEKGNPSKLNATNVKLFFQLYKHIEDRVKGSVIKREQRHQVTASVKENPQKLKPRPLYEIEADTVEGELEGDSQVEKEPVN